MHLDEALGIQVQRIVAAAGEAPVTRRAKRSLQAELSLRVSRLGVRAPFTPQRTALEEDDGSDSRAIVHVVELDVTDFPGWGIRGGGGVLWEARCR